VSNNNNELIDLVESRSEAYLGGGRRDERVLAAMRVIDRGDFLPTESRSAAYQDEPVGIGWGQTCSQPSIVAFMLDKLEIAPGAMVLEVGAGCGYAAAIAAVLCTPGGSVLALEIIPQLAAAARVNCSIALSKPSLSLVRPVEVLAEDGSAGLPGRLFDRIFLSAGISLTGFDEKILLRNLSDGGILLYPEARGRIFRVRKRGSSPQRESWGGVSFVRLRGKNS
jgi:protein-L-isoaspartate(D-aspartate) O-methyltransferase